jgi:hypothetical protein
VFDAKHTLDWDRIDLVYFALTEPYSCIFFSFHLLYFPSVRW